MIDGTARETTSSDKNGTGRQDEAPKNSENHRATGLASDGPFSKRLTSAKSARIDKKKSGNMQARPLRAEKNSVVDHDSADFRLIPPSYPRRPVCLLPSAAISLAREALASIARGRSRSRVEARNDQAKLDRIERSARRRMVSCIK